MIPETAFKSGSTFPPKESGVLRLYSMRLCPYAHRTRIVLAFKDIPHEVVNIDLKQKPEWYLEKINPLGKVPAIQKDDVIVFDSVIINEFLDDTYPEKKLLPSDPYQRAKDRMFLENWSRVIKPFYQLFFVGGEDKEAAVELFNALDDVEKELQARGTPFFGGNDMGMLDVLLWPHSERIDLFQGVTPDLTLPSERYPKFLSWLEAMKSVTVIKETATPPDVFSEFLQMVKNKNVDYDVGLKR